MTIRETQMIDTVQGVLLCVSCDGILCPQVGKLCDHCDELLAFNENGHSFPVALGHAIRRFLRRAEVEELVRRISDAATLLHRAADGEDTGHLGTDQDFCTIEWCAERLAALALEET